MRRRLGRARALVGHRRRVREDRLEQLLGRAALTRDYDVSQAVDKLISYLVSERGTAIREQLMTEIIDGTDEVS